jgi:hypothetical protein
VSLWRRLSVGVSSELEHRGRHEFQEYGVAFARFRRSGCHVKSEEEGGQLAAPMRSPCPPPAAQLRGRKKGSAASGEG